MDKENRMDQLNIKHLQVFANHGVFSAEKELGQKFVISLTIDYCMENAARNKRLESTIHYGQLCHDVTKWMQDSKEDLIETVAIHLIDQIFIHYPIAQSVCCEVDKPWAPIGLPLESCSVKITRTKNRVFLGLGSNMGDSRRMLVDACKKIKDCPQIKILNESSIITTKPWGGVEQNDFKNQVIEIETWLPPMVLLDYLQAIEKEMGRERLLKWGPRTIDLDILLYGDLVLENDRLIIPHPYMGERDFVLEPLMEIAPHKIHPVYHQSIRQLRH